MKIPRKCSSVDDFFFFYRHTDNPTMSGDQEELVSMIFGDQEPPENWRENPEFCLYLSEIGGFSADRYETRVGREVRKN